MCAGFFVLCETQTSLHYSQFLFASADPGKAWKPKKIISEYIPEFEKILSLSAVLGRLVGRGGNGGESH